MADLLHEEWLTFRRALVEVWTCHGYPTQEQLDKAERILDEVVPACEAGPTEDCPCYRCTVEQVELTSEVMDRWQNCSREEAIRQCEAQAQERAKWHQLFEQMRDERDHWKNLHDAKVEGIQSVLDRFREQIQ